MRPSVALLCVLGLVTASAQFVEVTQDPQTQDQIMYPFHFQEDDDVARPRRQLLQEDEGEPGEVQEEIAEEVTTTTTTTTEEPFDAADQAGPTRFYREYGNLPKFLMEVDNGNKIGHRFWRK